MKLNVTWKKSINVKEKQIFTWQKDNECFTCKKLKHYSQDCTQNKYKFKSSFYNKKEKTFAATKIAQNNHKKLSWTACYDDNCHTYLNDKKNLK